MKGGKIPSMAICILGMQETEIIGLRLLPWQPTVYNQIPYYIEWACDHCIFAKVVILPELIVTKSHATMINVSCNRRQRAACFALQLYMCTVPPLPMGHRHCANSLCESNLQCINYPLYSTAPGPFCKLYIYMHYLTMYRL